MPDTAECRATAQSWATWYFRGRRGLNGIEVLYWFDWHGNPVYQAYAPPSRIPPGEVPHTGLPILVQITDGGPVQLLRDELMKCWDDFDAYMDSKRDEP